MKVAIITGASRGIGRAIAYAMAGKDVYIAVCGRNEEAIRLVSQSLNKDGCVCHAFVGNVADYEFVSDMVQTVLSEAGHIDYLINNAGISEVGLFTDTTPEQWKTLMDINVSSIYNTCHCVVPSMVSSKSGRILNISSVWGLVGASCEVAYSASKGAVNSFTKALAKELAPSNIAVNAIAFGAIDTEMNAHLTKEDRELLEDEIPYGKMATPKEAATFAKQILSMPSYFTGEIVKFDGAWI